MKVKCNGVGQSNWILNVKIDYLLINQKKALTSTNNIHKPDITTSWKAHGFSYAAASILPKITLNEKIG